MDNDTWSRVLFGISTLLFLCVVGLSAEVAGLQDRVQQQKEQIQTLRGNLDSVYHRMAKLRKENRRLRDRLHQSILWTTRALVSETQRPREMRVIAEIIRNRVETGWRGNHTYKGVIQDPYQFSAFNPGRHRAGMFRRMNAKNTPYPELWNEARRIARTVILAPRDSLITSRNVTHFHHNYVRPSWSNRMTPVRTGLDRMTTYRNPSISPKGDIDRSRRDR